jgi:hypothetical protein
MFKSGSSWNLVPLLTSNTKGGWEGRAESSGIKLGRRTTYLATGSCITTNHKLVNPHLGSPLVLEQATSNTDSLDSPWPRFGGSHHLPPYSILCACPWDLHSNGFFSQDSQGGVPKLFQFGLLGLWEVITPSLDLRLGWGLKQTCSSCQELSNGVLHSTYRHQNWVDSQLLVVGSQIANLTPDSSFDHNFVLQMSEWLMQGHFRYLNFKNFPTILKTPQYEVFWQLQSSSKFLKVPEDSKFPLLGVWVSSSHLPQSGVATEGLFKIDIWCNWTPTTQQTNHPFTTICFPMVWHEIHVWLGMPWILQDVTLVGF